MVGDQVCGKTDTDAVTGWVSVECDVPLTSDTIKIQSKGETGLALCGIRVVGTNCWDRDSCEADIEKAYEAKNVKEQLELDAKNAYELFNE